MYPIKTNSITVKKSSLQNLSLFILLSLVTMSSSSSALLTPVQILVKNIWASREWRKANVNPVLGDAIHNYTRTNTSTEVAESTTGALDYVFWKGPRTTEEIFLMRGVTSDSLEEEEKRLQSTKYHTSTTYRWKTAYRFASRPKFDASQTQTLVIIVIRLPVGSPYLDLSNDGTEREILLSRFVSFENTRMDKKEFMIRARMFGCNVEEMDEEAINHYRNRRVQFWCADAVLQPGFGASIMDEIRVHERKGESGGIIDENDGYWGRHNEKELRTYVTRSIQ
jgi:hypothetical protein